MTNSGYHSGMNLGAALRVAAARGWVVAPVRRTGEVDVIAPGGDRVRLNGRRKDAPRSLTTLLRRHDPNRRDDGTPPAVTSGSGGPPRPRPGRPARAVS